MSLSTDKMRRVMLMSMEQLAKPQQQHGGLFVSRRQLTLASLLVNELFKVVNNCASVVSFKVELKLSHYGV